MQNAARKEDREKELNSLLQGKHVKLWPYFRGYYDRDILYRLWSLIEKEKATHFIFHGFEFQSDDSPVSTDGDLVDFIHYFEPISGHKTLLIVQDASRDEIAGFTWFEGITPGFRASAGIFMRRKYWGNHALEATQLSLKYIFQLHGLEFVYAITPWASVAKYAQRAGFKPVAQLKGFIKIQQAYRDIYILKITEDQIFHSSARVESRLSTRTLKE